MIYTIIEQILLYIPLFCGAYISMALMKISNLSIESAYLFGALLGAYAALYDVPLAIIILCSGLGGAVVGYITGWFAETTGFSHLLSSIITIGLFQGMVQLIINGIHLTISVPENPLNSLHSIQGYPHLTTIALISSIMIALYVVFLKSPLGKSCAMYGDNPLLFKNYRMNGSYIVISGLMFSNACAGISGYMIAQSNGFVDLYMGAGLPLFCLSSLILGKALYPQKKPIVMITPLLGALCYFILQYLLLQIGFDLRYFTAFQAIIIALTLSLSAQFIKASDRQNLLGI